MCAFFLVATYFVPTTVNAQVLTIRQAMQAGLDNYASIKAKQLYVQASEASVDQARREYLPNLVISAQQDYGTVNGQNGPLFGFGGYGVASSGLPLATQNWNAGFGALYLANVNWEFFTFGRMRERILVAKQINRRDQADLEQEQFQHQVKVAGAYLNFLAAHYITDSQRKNLERTEVVKNNVVVRALNGLIAGVDSSLANAEVSNARISLTRAVDNEQEQAARLAFLMGIDPVQFIPDSTLIRTVPAASGPTALSGDHPLLDFYRSRVEVGNEQLRLTRRGAYPSFSLFGVFQDRGSGFSSAYTLDQTAYTQNYWDGVKPTRANYLLGVGVTWNLTSIVRVNAQSRSQRFVAEALQQEYNLTSEQLKSQLALSEQKLSNAFANYREAPLQVSAATDAYNQKTALYRNGLSTMVEVTQAMYALNRAETDRDIVTANVWQALLLKAAASGDIAVFTKELN